MNQVKPIGARTALTLVEGFIRDELQTRKDSFLPGPTEEESADIQSAESALEAFQGYIHHAEALRKRAEDAERDRDGWKEECGIAVKHGLDALRRVAVAEAKLAGIKQEWRVNYLNGEGVRVDGYIFTSTEDRDEWIEYAKKFPCAYSDLDVQVRDTFTAEWKDAELH